MFKRFLTVFFLLQCPIILSSQNQVDSLVIHLNEQENDTNKIRTLQALVDAVKFKDKEKALEYANQLTDLAIEIDDPYWVADGYLKKGGLLRGLQQYDKAKEQLLLAEPLFEEAANYYALQKVYYELAVITKNMGEEKRSIDFHQKVFDLDELVRDHAVTARTYNSLGGIHYRKGEFDQARSWYLKGKELAKKYGIKSTEAFSDYLIGTMYMQKEEHANARSFLISAAVVFDSLGREARAKEIEMLIAIVESNLGNYEVAEGALLKTLAYFQEKNYGRLLISNYRQLSSNYAKMQEFSKAESTALEATRISKEMNMTRDIVASQINLAHAYLLNQKFQESLALIEETEAFNKANQDVLTLYKDLAHLRYETYQAMGQDKAALESYISFKVLDDSLKNRTDDERFAQLEVEYELDKKEQELSHQKQLVEKERRNNYLLFAGIALLLALVIIIFIFYYNKKQANKLLAEKNSLISEQADKLKELDATKTKFFNNVAHELRTPLTLMSGHLESMLNHRFGNLNENQRKSILVAKRNSSSLMNLVSEILDLGKLDSGKMELKETEIPLQAFLDRIFFTFESLAHQFEISLNFNSQLTEKVGLLADEQKIEKVLYNLIHNAIKFTERGGEIQLNVFEKEDSLMIEVEDSGRGIPLEEQSRVFERYFQTENKNAPAQGGTGIGLAIVKEFLELHAGSIKLESEPNKGSKFIIRLPNRRLIEIEASEQLQAINGLEEYPTYAVLDKKEMKILVVEDHKEMQQYLNQLITQYAKVYIANDGIEAMQILEKNQIDLMTVDLMMPNMDGISLLKKVKADPQYALLPTIMLTARAAEEDKLEALQLGVSDYVTKPFSQLELVARIANLIENKLSREEVQNGEDVDNQFIHQLRKLVDANLANVDFTVSMLAQKIGLSEKQLTRKVKKATGLTPLKFIREVKLLYVIDELKANKFHTVAEASYAIGIDNPSYFTKIFTERFGKNPSEYLS